MKRCMTMICMMISIILLVGCSNETYPSITEEGALAVTVNIKDMTISFIDIEAGEKINDWKMDKPYIGGIILPDGDRLLLYGKQLDTIDFFSLKEGKKISSWEPGTGIVNGVILSNHKELVFADQSLNALRFFSLDGEEIGTVKTNLDPLSLFEDNEEKRLYVISYKSKSTTIIDTESKDIITSFSIHPSATGAILKDGADEVWIGGHGEGSEVETDIHVYDTISGELIKKIPAPVMPVNFTQQGDFIYVLSHGSNTLYKLDKEGNFVTSTKVGANPFEMRRINKYIIIAGYDSNDIHLVNHETLKIEKTIPVGKGPFQLILRERLSDE